MLVIRHDIPLKPLFSYYGLEGHNERTHYEERASRLAESVLRTMEDRTSPTTSKDHRGDGFWGK